MKAVIYTHYGPPEVLHFTEIAKPAPRDNEVLVKVRATTVTIGDTIMRSFNLPVSGWQKLMARLILGIRHPKRHILGMELAGDIEAIGPAVTRFKIGDAVMASTLGVNFGGYAEYKCFPQDGMLVIKPAILDLRRSGGRCRRRDDGPALLAKSEYPQRAEGVDLWRVRRSGHLRGAVGQTSPGGRRNRCVQHHESGSREVAGSRSGGRLHPRRFHAQRPDL